MDPASPSPRAASPRPAAAGVRPVIAPGLHTSALGGLGIDAVVRAAAAAGLSTLEWDSRRHVRLGDAVAADEAGRRTREAGLAVSSYGPVPRAGLEDAAEFRAVLATARRLGAPRIRLVVPGGGPGLDAAERRATVAGVRRAVERAAGEGLGTVVEGAGPAPDTGWLLDEVDHPGLTACWWPPVGMPAPEVAGTLPPLLPRVREVWAFSWWPGRTRHTLMFRQAMWREVFAVLRGAGGPVDALLGPLPSDDPAVLASESAALRGLAAGG
ncbi:sugar phosphate isomerase/epimerase family protein [Allostreptomyces psammosilenae]|uniref:Sugar phosphate isomerase/epimerase n=1 Tax=Allostreptomyces psammosilenae TaxID=1892865 RepID=A0A852ZP88_9ACTN|nr:sugar phosphate isomerase/epimerase [Allostreptomyces psammosilenae]NYI04203.1 hypothetical protein [Allostreptomyces psammosilenae]